MGRLLIRSEEFKPFAKIDDLNEMWYNTMHIKPKNGECVDVDIAELS